VAYKKVFIPSPNLYRISEFIEKHVLKNLKIVGILYLLNYSDYCHVFCVTVSSITFSVVSRATKVLSAVKSSQRRKCLLVT